MVDESHEAIKAEADKLLSQIEKKFNQILKKIAIIKSVGVDHPTALADLAKLGKELKKMAQSLNGNFSSDGPFKQRTARLQKIAAAAVTSYKKALTGSSGSSTRVNVGEKKEAKTSTSELVDETIEIAGEIKTFSNQVLLFGQVVLVAHIFKITYERIKKRRSSKM